MKKRFMGVFPLAVCLVTLLLCSVNQVQAIDLQTNSPTYIVSEVPQLTNVASMESVIPIVYGVAALKNVVKQPVKHMPIHWADVLIRGGKNTTYIKQNRNRSVNQFDVRPQKK